MINEFFSDKEIGYLFFIGLFAGVISQPFIGALADKINKRNFIILLLSMHLVWPILLNIIISNTSIIWIAVIIYGIASVSLYTVTLAYLGERVNVAELSIATSVFIIVFESGEFFGPIIVGSSMDYFGNIGFIYSLFSFTFLSLFFGLIRTVYIKNKNGI